MSVRTESIDPDYVDIDSGRHVRRSKLLLLVILGGTLGTFLRASILQAFPDNPNDFWSATVIINLSGALLLGLILVLSLTTPSSPTMDYHGRTSPVSHDG